MSGELLMIVGGFALTVAAVTADPWGRKPWCAALFLLGAAMVVFGIAS